MQNVVDDVSLRPTAAGSTGTDTVVLLRLDSGALEGKFILDAFRSAPDISCISAAIKHQHRMHCMQRFSRHFPGERGLTPSVG